MNEVIVATDTGFFRLLVPFYFVEPFAFGLVADLAFNAVLFKHLFANIIGQFGT